MALLSFERNFNNMDLDSAKASVYTEKFGVFYVKLSLLEIGMYISGITVKKSPKYGGWWVQMPYFKDRTGSAKKYIEFDQESSARETIERLCIKAVEEKVTSSNSYNDTLPNNEDFDRPVDFSAQSY
jgi:hypothetical protein